MKLAGQAKMMSVTTPESGLLSAVTAPQLTGTDINDSDALVFVT